MSQTLKPISLAAFSPDPALAPGCLFFSSISRYLSSPAAAISSSLQHFVLLIIHRYPRHNTVAAFLPLLRLFFLLISIYSINHVEILISPGPGISTPILIFQRSDTDTLHYRVPLPITQQNAYYRPLRHPIFPCFASNTVSQSTAFDSVAALTGPTRQTFPTKPPSLNILSIRFHNDTNSTASPPVSLFPSSLFDFVLPSLISSNVVVLASRLPLYIP